AGDCVRSPAVGSKPPARGRLWRRTTWRNVMNRTSKGAILALSVAALFAARGAIAAEEKGKTDAKVHCSGVNECKGKGACAGGGHSCAGKNGCKGQGFVETSAAECQKMGGKVESGK